MGSDDRDAQGRLRGVDAHAYAWARTRGINRTLMAANWVGHGRSGGPRRNTRMLHYLLAIELLDRQAIMVIGFPGSDGTGDMLAQATRAGVQVLCYPALPPQVGRAA